MRTTEGVAQRFVRRILIADDDRLLCSNLRLGLESAGMEVREAHDGIEALIACRDRVSFQLAFVDLDMPNLNGMSLLQEIRKNYPELPVVILSGTVDREAAVECLKLGASDLLEKPCEFDRVIRCIEQIESSEKLKWVQKRESRGDVFTSKVVQLLLDLDFPIEDRIQRFLQALMEEFPSKKTLLFLFDERQNGYRLKACIGHHIDYELPTLPFESAVLPDLEMFSRSISEQLVTKSSEESGGGASCFGKSYWLGTPQFPAAAILMYGDSAEFLSELDHELLRHISLKLGLIVNLASLQTENQRLLVELGKKNQEQAQELSALRDQRAFLEKLAFLGEIAGSIAHDLNNPLSIAIHWADRARQKLKDSAEESGVNKVVQQLNRMKRIVSSIYRMSHTPQTPENSTPVDAKSIVDLAIGFLSDRISRLQVKVIVSVSAELKLLVNQTQIEQVIVNLLSNSIDEIAGQNNAEISVIATAVGKRVEFSIIDNGRGVHPSQVGNIFRRPFTTKGIGKGTGFGLHICKTIVESHGGKIWYERKEGKTYFSFSVLSAIYEGF